MTVGRLETPARHAAGRVAAREPLVTEVAMGKHFAVAARGTTEIMTEIIAKTMGT